jgi:hypothetical protein
MSKLVRMIPRPLLLAIFVLGVLILWAILVGGKAQAGWCAQHATRKVCRAAGEGDAFSMLTGRSCVYRAVCVRWVRERHWHDHDWRRKDPHWRDVERWDRRREVRGYERRYRDDDDLPPHRSRHERECYPFVQVKGSEAQTENGALISAKRAWRAEVRSFPGEMYIDLNNAKRAAFRCWRSSTNESTLGKAGEFVAGAYRKRCEVRARPCIGDWQKMDDDKDDRE